MCHFNRLRHYITGRGRDGDYSPPPHRSRRAAFPHRAPAGGRTRSAHEAFVPARNAIRARAAPFETCGFRCCARSMQPHPCIPPAAPLPSTPSAAAHHGLCSGASSVLRARPTRHPFPDGLPLGFPPRPGIAMATAGRMRSPRFRRLPFVPDGVFDHGRASAPRKTAPHMSPSALSTASASAGLCLSRLNSRPRTIAVYASRRSSPSAPVATAVALSAPVRARYGDWGEELKRTNHQGQRSHPCRTTGRRHDRARDARKSFKATLDHAAPSRHDSACFSPLFALAGAGKEQDQLR